MVMVVTGGIYGDVIMMVVVVIMMGRRDGGDNVGSHGDGVVEMVVMVMKQW